MNRILLIVEGEKREKDFFEQYKKVKKFSDDLEIVPFCQNIKELFRLSKEYIFNGIKPNNIIDILMDSNISEDDKKKLEGRFTDVYLIFDLDIQNAKTDSAIIDYLNDIKDLILFYDDSTSIGQILINYPSMDSIYHIRDDEYDSYKDIKIKSSIIENEDYKIFLSEKKLTYDCSKLTQNDFNMLAAINLKKANYIVNKEYQTTDHKTYEYTLTQMNILEAQIKNILDESFLFVLNSSLFIDIDLFGKELYFHLRGERLYLDSLLLDSLKHK